MSSCAVATAITAMLVWRLRLNVCLIAGMLGHSQYKLCMSRLGGLSKNLFRVLMLCSAQCPNTACAYTLIRENYSRAL